MEGSSFLNGSGTVTSFYSNVYRLNGVIDILERVPRDKVTRCTRIEKAKDSLIFLGT